MNSGQTSIDVRKHPIGYITDYVPVPDLTTVNPSKNIDIRLMNIPDAASVTFNIDFVNLTVSQNPTFKIFSFPSGVDIYSYISQENLTLRTFPTPSAYMTLEYENRNQCIAGELVRIKYKGLS